jgi:inorganic pyrophosphatase
VLVIQPRSSGTGHAEGTGAVRRHASQAQTPRPFIARARMSREGDRSMTTPAPPRNDSVGGPDAGWVEAVIEIPKGSRNKYEYDHRRGVFRLDRVLYSSVHYPTDYGFIDETLSGDGDPLDILVIVEEPTFTGCRLRARPIGTLQTVDAKGSDEKILAVPVDDPRFNGIDELDQLHPHWALEIATFFGTYKELQGEAVDVKGWHSAQAAWRVIAESRERFTQQG